MSWGAILSSGRVILARVMVVAVLAALVAAGAFSPPARADGDPGSDVLVFQNLFVGSDAGLSVAEQVQLGGLLQAAGRAGFPVRVAIIARSDDLGAVTALWHEPRAYARFLGIELSLAYKQRLLVVMPNGFGFNWPGHSTTSAYRWLAKIPIKPGPNGLIGAAQAAVRALAAAGGVRIGQSSASGQAATTAGSGGAAATTAGSGGAAATTAGSGGAAATSAGAGGGAATTPASSGRDRLVAIVTAALAALAALVLTLRLWFRRRPDPDAAGANGRSSGRLRAFLTLPSRSVRGVAVIVGVAIGAPILAVSLVGGSSTAQSDALAINPYLDPGTPLSGPAPDFALSDQFGQPVSLDSFRGKVVILAFTDSECTTLCPLTATAMVDAKAMLGAAGSRVQLLGIDADPAATALEDVWSYSELHGMLHEWRFLTGSLSQLQRVWKAYGVDAEIEHGLITHTPALFVIDQHGREAKVYMTQQSYAAVGQLGQLLAQEASSLLPEHPRVRSDVSYSQIAGIGPASSRVVPRAGGGTVRLGPGRAPRLFVFFATWDQEVTSLAGQLEALNAYQSAAAASGLPSLTAVDEGSVEPSSAALSGFLRGLARPLSYPVAIDQTGQLADGYEVQGVPWFVLTSPTGRILWDREVSTSGWLTRGALKREVRDALARAPSAPASAAAEQQLAGSPAPLAALHGQAGELLGGESPFAARVRALRGFPVVINVWASWCTPCRSEFALFAVASAHYGREVAFLGADSDDSPSDARAFLAQHPISYPSYQTSITDLGSLAVIAGLPTTIFINRAGKVVYVHDGQYFSQGTLDSDIESYALGG